MPSSMPSITSWGACFSTVQPTLWQVPRISFTVLARVRPNDLKRIVRAMLMISSRVMLPLCTMFLVFLRSRGGSAKCKQPCKPIQYIPFRALMTSDDAEGTMAT